MNRRGTSAPTPIGAAPRSSSDVAPNATALTSDTAAVGFQRTPASSPNPVSQPATGTVLASLAKASAIAVGTAAGVSAWAFPLPPYVGYCDLSLWAQLTSSPALGPPDLWWYVTNGRVVPLAAQASAALRTQLVGLTMLYGSDAAAEVGAFEVAGSPGGADAWPALWSPRSRVWLPPGQNDVFLIADGGAAGAGATAAVWWTAIAAPATEQAIVTPGT